MQRPSTKVYFYIGKFQATAFLRADVDTDDDVPRDSGVPRAAGGGGLAPRLPLEAAGRDRPARDEGDAAHQPAPAEAYTARPRSEPLPQQGQVP